MLRTLRRSLPRISATERVALEAGTVWLEGDLFRGKPDFRRMLEATYPRLSEAEQAFLEGPTEQLCALVDDWQTQQSRELPEAAWELIRQERFLGLGIPERYGGRGFSTLAQSSVVGKLASRSNLLSVIVLIPNSVGPAELLLHHGTEEQRDRYLPALARGGEIPCFALTELEAGSDAASLTSSGEVFPGIDGEPRVRLDFDKRYITLAPIATLIGLAFRLRDPAEILGRGPEPGITCALVPATAPGVEIGERHDPLGLPFPNGPLRGRAVEIDLNQVIGGIEGVGQGWRMLMESLSAGRAVSLPAQAAAGAKWVSRVTGAYASLRRQFGMPIARFEGIEEPLARIGGLTYLMEAARVFTCGAVDAGERPALVSSIVKVWQTELARELIREGMDVLGGAAIFRGPRNLLANAWLGAPIGITVEGANILTRSLVIFGQGALRCHPWLLRELEAVEAGRAGDFGRALAGHALHFAATWLRAVALGSSRGRLAASPVSGPTARHYRRLAWASARFALLTELALLALGGEVKRREKISGRFADALSWMYLGICTLRRFEAEGRREEDLPLVHWALEDSLDRIERAFEGIRRHLPGPLAALLLRGPLGTLSRLNRLGRGADDEQGREVAALLRQPGEPRERLTSGLFTGTGSNLEPLERAFQLDLEAAPVRELLRQARRAGQLPDGPLEHRLSTAVQAGLVSQTDADRLLRAEAARREAITVDVLSVEEPCVDVTH